jgi:hypothetical protein
VNHATNALGLSFRGFEFDAVSVRIRARFGAGYDSGHAPANPIVRRRAPARVSKGTAPARKARGKRAREACAGGCAKGTQSVTQTAGAPVAQTDEGPGVLQHRPGPESDTQNEHEKGRS